MRVLYVSKASIVPAYRDKLHALAAHADVTAVIPMQWGRTRADVLHCGGDEALALDHAAHGAAALDRADTADVAGGACAAGGSVARADIRTAHALLHGHNHLHMYRAAASLVRHAAPDLVHLDEEPYSAVTFQLARICRRAHVPYVFFAWQNLHKRLPPPFGLMRRYVFAHAAAAIAGTPRAAEVLRRAGWRGTTAVIPQLGISPARFRPDARLRAAVRERLGIAPDAFVVGCAARLVPEKGVDLLLDATAPLNDTQVLVIGDGPERRRLAERATALGMNARTRFTGEIESLAVPAWLNAMDVLVLPSRRSRRWAEQFGRILVEAMACGVPVVGALSGEIPAVIGASGLTFAEGDVVQLRARIERLRGSAEERRRLSASGRTRALEHFTHERIGRETAVVYAEVLRAPQHAVPADPDQLERTMSDHAIGAVRT